MDAEEVTGASARLEIRAVEKSYGSVPALRGVDLEARAGELLTILGPSGSGKTTLLKVVAGFEIPEGGTVLLGGADITAAPPRRREIGMVFQNYALFPHMTVAGNIAFPLEMRRVPRREISRRVASALELVGLAGFAERLPRQLSGGQQQRIAFARAVVFEPMLLLLDEPFGALDRKLRDAMQLEVRALQRRLGITTVFITHDQEEALVLSDRIAVMNAGRIEQVGTPAAIYETPTTPFTAAFIGESNLLRGEVIAASGATMTVRCDNGLVLPAKGGFAPGARVAAMIRPERLEPAEGPFRGTVAETVYVGDSMKYRLVTETGAVLHGRVPAAAHVAPPVPGQPYAVRVAPEDVHLLADH